MEFSNTNENICVSRNSELDFPLSISENSECYFYPAYVNHIWDPSIPHRKNIRKYTPYNSWGSEKGFPLSCIPEIILKSIPKIIYHIE